MGGGITLVAALTREQFHSSCLRLSRLLEPGPASLIENQNIDATTFHSLSKILLRLESLSLVFLPTIDSLRWASFSVPKWWGAVIPTLACEISV